MYILGKMNIFHSTPWALPNASEIELSRAHMRKSPIKSRGFDGESWTRRYPRIRQRQQQDTWNDEFMVHLMQSILYNYSRVKNGREKNLYKILGRKH